MLHKKCSVYMVLMFVLSWLQNILMKLSSGFENFFQVFKVTRFWSFLSRCYTTLKRFLKASLNVFFKIECWWWQKVLFIGQIICVKKMILLTFKSCLKFRFLVIFVQKFQIRVFPDFFGLNCQILCFSRIPEFLATLFEHLFLKYMFPKLKCFFINLKSFFLN